MEPVPEPLRMFGRPAETDALDWPWVQQQLEEAGIYWIDPRSAGAPDPHLHPHPRPVWGIWHSQNLYMSVGSAVIARRLATDPVVTVHLESGTDVVIVEGTAVGSTADLTLIERYNSKYDWDYAVDDYGPLTHIDPTMVFAWRSAGWAGRDGFRSSGRWRLKPG